MSIFNRLFTVSQAEEQAIVDKFEDPLRMTEQGIRDLKKELQASMSSLAELKAIAVRTRRESKNHKKLAVDYERKAMMLLQKMQSGELDPAEAERLAAEALNQKEQLAAEAVRVSQEADRHEQMAGQLQEMVAKFKARRDLIVEGLNELPGVSCLLPKGAFYAFPDVRETGLDCEELADALLEEAGVALLAGTSFGRQGDGFLRLSYANSQENIQKALARIGDHLAAARR